MHSESTPRINISICISQPYPEIISTGIIIQLRENDLLIQAVIEGSFLLPVLSFPGSAGFGGRSPTRCSLSNTLTGQHLAFMGNFASVFEEAAGQRQSYSCQGDPSWNLIILITLGVRQSILSPSLLKLSWGVV